MHVQLALITYLIGVWNGKCVQQRFDAVIKIAALVDLPNSTFAHEQNMQGAG